MNNSDLHSHSYYSDGILSPKDVVMRAKEKGVENLALTDHNSLEGIKEALEEGEKIGVNVVPGVEIKFRGGEILGYYINIENSQLKSFLRSFQKQSIKHIKEYCTKLRERGYDISFESLVNAFPHAKDNLNWYHICYFFFNKKLRSSLKETAKMIFDANILMPRKNMSPEEVIKIINNAGGVAVLAHPWITKTSLSLLEDSRIKELVKIGLKGIEIDQGDRNERRTEEVLNKIKEVAKNHNLILTSGSDFHGDFLIDKNENSTNHEIGAHNCDEIVIEKLKSARGALQRSLF